MNIPNISQELMGQLNDSANASYHMTDELYCDCQDIDIEEDVWISELRADYYQSVL